MTNPHRMNIEKQHIVLSLLESKRYMVDLETGKVYSLIGKEPREAKPNRINGYLQYQLDIGFNGKIQAYGQGIVYLAKWREIYDPKFVIDHIDGVRDNNHPDNLRCVTHKQNLQSSWDSGTRKRKYAFSPKVRLPVDIRADIRARIKAGESQVSVAKVYGTTRQTVARIVQGNR